MVLQFDTCKTEDCKFALVSYCRTFGIENWNTPLLDKRRPPEGWRILKGRRKKWIVDRCGMVVRWWSDVLAWQVQSRAVSSEYFMFSFNKAFNARQTGHHMPVPRQGLHTEIRALACKMLRAVIGHVILLDNFEACHRLTVSLRSSGVDLCHSSYPWAIRAAKMAQSKCLVRIFRASAHRPRIV